jgi:hypothetical protein
MIVERRTYRIKPFCEQAAADFVIETQGVFGRPNVVRLYMPISGPGNVIYQEFEFGDWQEREEFWAAFFALPEMPEWVEKWKTLTESSGRIEFLRLVE